MNPLSEPHQGLSKRQQSKQQKIVKANETNKSQTHAKSYKRKAKGKHPEQCAQRKLIKSEADHSQSSEANYLSTSGFKEKIEQQPADKKKKVKVIKPFNPKFKVDGGEEGLFEYIMTYAYVEKTKKFDAPIEDPSFLDEFDGEPLQIVNQGSRKNEKNKINAQFQTIKQKIETPFDQIHKSFARKISGFPSKQV